MPTIGNDATDAEELAGLADRHRDAWSRTLEDMTSMAAEREEAGWETVVVPAGDTAPEPPEAGPEGRFGLVHVVPGNKADPFREAFEGGEFPVYDVYRAEVEGRVFLVTELLDPDTETAVYVAGNFELMDAGPLIETVEEEEVMYTHLQKLDTTHLGSFEHEDYEKFFPRFETF